MCRHLAIIVVSLVLPLLTGCSSTKTCAIPGVQTRPSTQNSATPSVHLNHVYLTLDAETFAAINESSFMRDRFCLFGHSIPEPSASNAVPTTYLIGQNTCLELLAAANTRAETEGNAGVCFSTRQAGDIDIVYDNLCTALGPDIQNGYVTFNTGARRIPWLRYVSSHRVKQTPPLLTWVVEYDAKFHKAVGFSSGRHLAKLRQTDLPTPPQKQYPQKLLRNIESVTLAVTQPEFNHLSTELAAFGYVRKEQKGLTVFSGPGVEIRAVVAPDPQYRIRSLQCSLTSKAKTPTQKTFGDKATLTLTEDAAAIWTFGPHQEHYARN